MSWSSRASADMESRGAEPARVRRSTGRDGPRRRTSWATRTRLTARGRATARCWQQITSWREGRLADAPRSRGGFEETQEHLSALAAELAPARMRRDDAQLIVDELRSAAALASAGAGIGAAKYARANGASPAKVRRGFRDAAKRITAAIPEYERLWGERNRPGGRRDSAGRLHETVAMLQEAAT